MEPTDEMDQLEREIATLRDRIAHLGEQADAVETGVVDWRKKRNGDDALVSSEEGLKFNFSAAVSYWKEIRETEKRLDDLRARLRELRERGDLKALHVVVQFEGPDDA